MAANYLSPGVYVEEVDSGARPLEMVGSSTAAFLGECRKGPIDEPFLCCNWSMFTKTFGDFSDSEHLAQAVYGFFSNGGGRCWIVNVGLSESGETEEIEPDNQERPKKSSRKTRPDKIARFTGRDDGIGRKTGLKSLETLDDISLVAIPGITDPEIQDAVLTHCEIMKYRFAILDCPETIEKGGVETIPRPRPSKHGAIYFPWIEVASPVHGRVMAAPSGFVAGIYARCDAERGVHKAPANELVRGALGLKYLITTGEQDLLNPRGINCIRSLPGSGIRVWGARTLSDDPVWRYVNVRRLFLMTEQSIERGTGWVVFEPNDERLWKRLSRDLTAFMLRLWRQGALFGKTPEQAFFVKCDSETNPEEVINAGRVVVDIGMSPVKPAEFVVFRIGQMAGGADVKD